MIENNENEELSEIEKTMKNIEKNTEMINKCKDQIQYNYEYIRDLRWRIGQIQHALKITKTIGIELNYRDKNDDDREAVNNYRVSSSNWGDYVVNFRIGVEQMVTILKAIENHLKKEIEQENNKITNIVEHIKVNISHKCEKMLEDLKSLVLKTDYKKNKLFYDNI